MTPLPGLLRKALIVALLGLLAGASTPIATAAPIPALHTPHARREVRNCGGRVPRPYVAIEAHRVKCHRAHGLARRYAHAKRVPPGWQHQVIDYGQKILLCSASPCRARDSYVLLLFPDGE